jgi:predicted nucleotidyltransferase
MQKHHIIKKLIEIATTHGVQLLFACESGSRGWQFPSPDSDYDVRFIYARPLNDYLSVSEFNDQIGFYTFGEMDICGWDIRKVLQLTRKSNTTPFEWLQSPIVYMQQPGFREELWALCEQYFNARSNMFHYLGVARSALETVVNKDEIKIKKLFYVLRPLLSAKWCMEKNCIAPMTIRPLMSLMPERLQLLTDNLISLKATTPEAYIVKIEPEMKQFIENTFDSCTQAVAAMPIKNYEIEPLNLFFRKTIIPQ